MDQEVVVKTKRIRELEAIRAWLPGNKTTRRQAADFAFVLALRAIRATDLDGIAEETARRYTKRAK